MLSERLVRFRLQRIRDAVAPPVAVDARQACIGRSAVIRIGLGTDAAFGRPGVGQGLGDVPEPHELPARMRRDIDAVVDEALERARTAKARTDDEGE